MSGWPSKAAAALLPFLVLPAAIAAAQTTAPAEGTAVGPPVLLTPPPEETPSAAPAPSPPAPVIERAPEGIEVAPLGEIATDYGGTLDPRAGGFPLDMWRDSDRGFVERLLAQLPVVPQSPALRSLARRLLLSSVEAPEGPATVDLRSVRADRLMALGERRAAAELLALVPESKRDATTERLRLESAWLAGEDEKACGDVANLIRRYDQDLYLQKALIFCQARAGQTDEATLGLDLLREQGHADEDGAFFDLVGVLTGLRQKAEVETLDEPKGLHVALLRAAGLALPESAAADPELAGLRLAGSAAADALAATEQAVIAGLAEPSALAQAYRAEAVATEDLAGASDLEPDSPHARAALFQAAAQAEQPTRRALLIQRALGAARGTDGYLTAVRVYLPMIEQIDPTPATAAAAGELGRAPYVGGRYELAGAWLDLARRESQTNPNAAAAVAELSVLARLAGGVDAGAWDANAVAAWLAAQGGAGDAEADLRAARLFALFDGLGQPVGPAWRMLADPAATNAPPMPDPALWFALGDAAGAGRLGETVMLALYVLGPEAPGGAHPIALSRALAALRQVGLEDEARAIAFEAALANGA